MAGKRRAGGGAGAAGFKSFVATAGMILLLAGAVVGWWNYNGFKSVDDALDWFAQKSANMSKCVNEPLKDGGADDVRNVVDAHGCLIPNLGGNGGTNSGTGGVKQGQESELSDDSKTTLLTQLEKVKVAAPQKVNYNRSQWRHWLDLNNNGCDTREEVLIANGENVKTDPKTCKVLSGEWLEGYAGKTFTDSSAMDLDHVVPLSWAARNGGNSWDEDKKAKFANNLNNLVLSDASENRSKGDKGPSEYMPPNKKFQCGYAQSFASVVMSYGLTLPQADKDSLIFTIKNKC